jgi:hypothetical protein
MGKRVLRPGGMELTRELLGALDIGPDDDVVEFAPGLGATARITLARNPRSYTAVERDARAAEQVQRLIAGRDAAKCISGTAEETGLPEGKASVVYGEAMLSMQPESAKRRIAREACRLLAPRGRYGIHELALAPDDADPAIGEAIQRDLSDEIHVGVRPLTIAQWRELLEIAGLEIVFQHAAPMHLLEPARLVRDEGLFGALKFAWNAATHPTARRRIVAMRRVFRKYAEHLAAVALVGVKACPTS